MALSQTSRGLVPASVPGKAVVPVFLHLLHAHRVGTLSQCVVGLARAFSLSFPPHLDLNSHGQTWKALTASRNHQECASFISLPFLFPPLYLASCL